jgi:ubiquinone/menaquinone biosynthesis C-methylase UbiE
VIPYSKAPQRTIRGTYREIPVFAEVDHSGNIDTGVVKSFADEWKQFHGFREDEINRLGAMYFDILEPYLTPDMHVLDVGCGTGRWSKYLASKVASVTAVDPGEAVLAADEVLGQLSNVRIAMAPADDLPFPEQSFDVVMSIGVLHHIPDTQKAMNDCVRMVKPGGYFYTYLYYNLENRGAAFRFIFSLSNGLRRGISTLPRGPKHAVCNLIAGVVYYPLARGGKWLRQLGLIRLADRMPLRFYQNTSFYIMRNDALDRFGTSLEQRFSKDDIIRMMEQAGLRNIVISDKMPYWHATGIR